MICNMFGLKKAQMCLRETEERLVNTITSRTMKQVLFSGVRCPESVLIATGKLFLSHAITMVCELAS